MNYDKPKVTIDLDEYNELIQKKNELENSESETRLKITQTYLRAITAESIHPINLDSVVRQMEAEYHCNITVIEMGSVTTGSHIGEVGISLDIKFNNKNDE